MSVIDWFPINDYLLVKLVGELSPQDENAAELQLSSHGGPDKLILIG